MFEKHKCPSGAKFQHFFKNQQSDLDLSPRDPQNQLRSSTHLPSLATIKQRGKKILTIFNIFSKISSLTLIFDHVSLKINWGHLLIYQVWQLSSKGVKKILTYRLTAAKQYVPFFKGGIKIINWVIQAHTALMLRIILWCQHSLFLHLGLHQILNLWQHLFTYGWINSPPRIYF